MGILSWIVFGLVAGVVAKVIMPGKDPGGIIVTMLLGIGGAITGGLLAWAVGFGGISAFDFRSLTIAIFGAVILLIGYRYVATKTITCSFDIADAVTARPNTPAVAERADKPAV